MDEKFLLEEEIHLRREARELCREMGTEVALNAVYEMLFAAKVFMEVINEEVNEGPDED